MKKTTRVKVMMIAGVAVLTMTPAYGQVTYSADANTGGSQRLFFDATPAPVGSTLWFVADVTGDGLLGVSGGTALDTYIQSIANNTGDDKLVKSGLITGGFVGAGKFSATFSGIDSRFGSKNIYAVLWNDANANTVIGDVGDTFGTLNLGVRTPPEFGNASWVIGSNINANTVTVTGDIALARPDLTSSAGATFDKTTVTAGQSFTLRMAVNNIGNAASVATKINFYLDTTYSYSAARKIGEISVPALAAGGTASGLSFTYAVPIDKPAGTYLVYYWIDSSLLVTENNENNNVQGYNLTVVAGTPVDLVATGTISPLSGLAGETFTMKVNVDNRGTLLASAATKLYFYLHKDSADYSMASMIGEVDVPVLNPDEIATDLTLVYTVSESTVEGSYYFSFWIDAPNLVAEGREDNNQGFWRVPILSLETPVEIDQFPNLRLQLTLSMPDLSRDTISLIGPTVVQVRIGPNGEATDTDRDGRDQVPTEIVSMSLTGTSRQFGPVSVGLSGLNTSRGEIEEQVNSTPGTLDVPPFTATGTADSFFDVFFEITMGGRVLHSAQPARLASAITYLAAGPGETYVSTDALDLLDANGKSSGIRITRIDITPRPPRLEIVCPPDMTVTACDAAGAVVTYPPATASGGCPPLTVTCNPPSGIVFPIGTSTVTCTVQDGCGQNASCTFTVIVTPDPVPPVAICPQNMSVNTDPGVCGADVDFNVDATDNCPGEMVKANPPPGFFPVGNTLVTVTATDAAGNTNTCTFNVRVVDSELPVITCPPDIVVDADPGQCGAVVNFAAPATDNCPGVVVTYSPAPGSKFPVGSTLVTCMATDAAGNGSSCTFNVTVRDTQPPVVICPPDIVIYADLGQVSQHMEFNMESIARDNCPRVTITYSPPSGSEFPIGTNTVTATAMDRAGNMASCNFNVVVRPFVDIEVDQFPNSWQQLILCLPDGRQETVIVRGETVVHVRIGPNGEASDTDGNGREQVHTELVRLALTGTNPTFGTVTVQLNTNLISGGEIEEQVNSTPGTLDVAPFTATGLADSFFDVFLEVTLQTINGPLVLRNFTPKRIVAVIDHKPPGPGTAYHGPARIELYDQSGTNFATLCLNREILQPEEPEVDLAYLDFGDAPDPLDSYGTRLIKNGARHVAVGPRLGALRDVEADGQPTPNCDGDDVNGTDDEDGVTLPTLYAGQSATAAVVVQGGAAKLDAWIDFNPLGGTGDWNDPGEQIITNLAVNVGTNSVTFLVPATALGGPTRARFRLSTAGGLSPLGFAANGEVEDYYVKVITLIAISQVVSNAMEDSAVSITLGGSGAEPLTFLIVTGPQHGTLSALSGANVTYTPNPNFNGQDSFTFAVTDGIGTATATVTVNIAPVNDNPVAVNDTATTNEDTPVDVAVLSNDSDVDQDALSVTGVTDPAHGTAALTADNKIKYTPDASFNGTDSFTYTISDGQGGTAAATVTVTVSFQGQSAPSYHGGMIQYSRWLTINDDAPPPIAETLVWTPEHVYASPPMPTAPANPVFTAEILDPSNQPITSTHGAIAWAGEVGGSRASHVVIWTDKHVYLHERIANATVEVMASNGAPIIGARGALGYRASPDLEFANREFVVWTDNRAFRVQPGVGASVANVFEVFLPDNLSPMSAVRGVAAYEELSGPWTGTTLVFWREPAGVHLYSVGQNQSFAVVDPNNAPIVDPRAVLPYQRTLPSGQMATELYIVTPGDVLRRPGLGAGAVAPFTTLAFTLPNGTAPISNARSAIPFERVTVGAMTTYSEVLFLTPTQVLLWSEMLQPGMATLPLVAPDGNNISDPEGAVAYLNYGPSDTNWVQWTEIVIWTKNPEQNGPVYLHATPIHYPGPPLATLTVQGPDAVTPLTGIRGAQAYPRVVNGLFYGMELLMWGARVYINERYYNLFDGVSQEVVTPAGAPITGARSAVAFTRAESLISVPRTQVALWRDSNVYLLDGKPPAPTAAMTVELVTPATDAPPSGSITNVWGVLCEPTIWHPQANEIWLWRPDRVLLHREGSMATIDVLTPDQQFIGTAEPGNVPASLAVNYGCVPPASYPHSPTNGFVAYFHSAVNGSGSAFVRTNVIVRTDGIVLSDVPPPRPPPENPPPPQSPHWPEGGSYFDPGAGFQGPPSFAPVVRTVINGVVESGQAYNADVFVPAGSPSQRSSALYVTQPMPRIHERAAIIGPAIVASVVPQCGCIYFTSQSGEPTVDLSVTKSDAPDPVIIGASLTYTITVSNNGASPASGVMLTDNLPVGVTFISASASQGSCSVSGATVTCALGSLASGASAAVTVVVSSCAAGTTSNTAGVTANEIDPNPANDSATAATTVVAPQLEITLVQNNLEITWPATAIGFVLESTASLSAPITWTLVPEVPQLVGNQWKVILPAPSGSQFFRLKKVCP